MLITHPYIGKVHVEELRLPDGTIDRVLIVESKIRKPQMVESQNDNKMDELVRQLQSLDTLARHGFTDFQRIEIRDTSPLA